MLGCKKITTGNGQNIVEDEYKYTNEVDKLCFWIEGLNL